MNCIIVPSLKRLALVQVAASLWTDNDIKILLDRSNYKPNDDKRYKKWAKIEKKIIKEVPKLSLPENLREKLFTFINPIGLEILYWMETVVGDCCLSLTSPGKFIWSPRGTIDKRKTAKNLVKDDSLNIAGRFKLACMCCLSSDIFDMWRKTPSTDVKHTLLHVDVRTQHDLVHLWTYIVKRDRVGIYKFIERRLQRPCSPSQFGFVYAAECGNKIATEYFLDILHPNERETSIVRTAEIVVRKSCNLKKPCAYNICREDYAEILCLLLSHMDKEQEKEFLKKHTFEVLKCLADWPCQKQFVEIARCSWDFLPKSSFGKLLKAILKKVSYKDCIYNNLFVRLWKESPAEFKRYAVFDKSWKYIIYKLFMIDDRKSIGMILQETTARERKRLLISHSGYKIYAHLILHDKWDLLKFIITECLSSSRDLAKLMDDIYKAKEWWITRGELLRIPDDKFDAFYSFLEDLQTEMFGY